MEKKHKLLINKIKIISALLEYGKSIEWRKKVIGYGLKGSDFGKINQKNTIVSRDIFNDYLKELLSNRYITQLKTSDRRSRYYTITPYGIFYLINNSEIKSINVRRILDILLFFYDKEQIKYGFLKRIKIENDFRKKILNIYKEKKIASILEDTIRECTKISEKGWFDATITIDFGYIQVFLASILVGENRITWIENNSSDKWENFKFALNDKEFFSYLSLYILVLFFYNIFKDQYLLGVKLINKSQKIQYVEKDNLIKTIKKSVISLLQHSEKQIAYDTKYYLKYIYQNINTD